MAVVGTTGFGVDVDLDGGDASRSPLHEFDMGTRVLRAFQEIMAISRPSESGFWLPVYMMTHPWLRAPVRLLANVSKGQCDCWFILDAKKPRNAMETAL